MKAVWPVGRRLFGPEGQPGGGLSRCGAGQLGWGEHRSGGCGGDGLDGYRGDVGRCGSDERDRNGAAWGPGLGCSLQDFTGQGRVSCRGGLERGGCSRRGSDVRAGRGQRGAGPDPGAGMRVPRNPGLHRVQPVWCRGSGFTADFKPGHI